MSEATINPDLLDKPKPKAQKSNVERIEELEALVASLQGEVAALRAEGAKAPSAFALNGRKRFYVTVNGKRSGFDQEKQAARFAEKNNIDPSLIVVRPVDENGYPLDEEASSPRRRAVG